MGYLLFIVRSALEDFKRSKMQTFLTSLGIVIGVFAVIMLMALGLGLKRYISDQFEALGKNTLFVTPGQVLQGGGFGGAASVLGQRFDIKDLTNLSRVKGVVGLAPLSSKSGKAKGTVKTEYISIFFTSADFADIAGLTIDKGRFFDKTDIDKHAKVLVAGPKIAEKLFGSTINALDKRVSVDNVNFTIIGIIKSKGGGGLGGNDYDSYFFGPYTTGFIYDPQKQFIRFAIKTDPNIPLATVKAEINKVMLKRYKDDEFSLLEPTEILSVVNSIFNIMNIVLVAIASISLLVGGIGIMNIMYVTVSDKTREVGVRRALGARKNDILLQFIVESVALSIIGGALGLGLAFLGVLLVQGFFPAYIDVPSMVLALGVSSAIGIVFGVLPARKAANLEPVEAIRYE
ncbi:ABC transporter permease [Patescibacteria group bacterium]|nr:ABC transporter permease [Patescibacteria group bacterium]MCL5091462.1 ABC transporter permease [Patescibacteria group bacterium]